MRLARATCRGLRPRPAPVACLLAALSIAAAGQALADDGGPDRGGASAAPGAEAVPASRPAAAAPPATRPARDAGAGLDGTPDAARELPGWAPKLSATVKPAIVLLGDPVKITVNVRHQKGISVNLPLDLDLGKFTEISRRDSTREVSRKGARVSVERTFELKAAAYELGEHTLPAVEVTALGPGGELISLKTMPIPIQVRGVLRNEPNAKLKALEPPVQVFEITWWMVYLLIALAAVGVVVTATLLINRHLRTKRKALAPPPPPPPPHIRALERLAALDLKPYIAEERFKELYLLLSEILREYAGDRWGFDALEMTTTEIKASLAGCDLAPDVQAELMEFFVACDLVKFAKYRPAAEGAREAHETATELVRSTALSPPGREEPASAGAAGSAPDEAGPAGASPARERTRERGAGQPGGGEAADEDGDEPPPAAGSAP